MIDKVTIFISRHPIGFTLALFVIGTVISIYSDVVRRFLAMPPQQLNVWIARARLASAKSSLRAMEECRADAGQLLVRCLLFLVPIAVWGLLMVSEVWLRMSGDLPASSEATKPTHFHIVATVVNIAGGALFTLSGVVYGLNLTFLLLRLRFYADSSDMLLKRIEQLERYLGEGIDLAGK